MVISTKKGENDTEKVSAQDVVMKDGIVELLPISTLIINGGNSNSDVTVMKKFEMASPHHDEKGKNMVAK
eukprot:10391593-Ditylum_brightwellii.AAC.1